MKKIYSLLVISVITLSCNKTDDTSNQTNGISIEAEEEWLIARREIKDGGAGKDGIPSIDNPEFIDDAGLEDDELVVGIYFEGEARAYPHYILDWHEIVNDVIGNDPIALSYCPLTGTAFAWEREADNADGTFGVSGLLYNSNLLLYDRKTESLWSQLKLQCVNGDLVGERPTLFNVVETDWKTWKKLYPETLVLSEDTGFSRNYDVYPYGDYKTNDNYFLFLPAPHDRRLLNKKRVYAIIDEDKSKVYQFEDFMGGNAIIDTFNNKKYLIVGDEHILNSFELSQDNEGLVFEYELSDSGGFFKDDLGTVRNVFGGVLSGNLGDYLTPANSVVSYWFAIGAFYPDAEIYQP
ncbi:DUF3179 domain-containing protein [Pontimicrobium sp. SW4]|uniref:DUF3179 domain-containing protein n=1 Tax=Pontimicrobium sp. SW4 TaxID=3153519 RepID=A0AAU7BQZ3_9FLAO